jgi:hypothetical protein
MSDSNSHHKDPLYQKVLALNPVDARTCYWIGRVDLFCAVGATVSCIAALVVFGEACLRDGWSGGSSVSIGWFFVPSLLSFLLLLGIWQRQRILRRNCR